MSNTINTQQVVEVFKSVFEVEEVKDFICHNCKKVVIKNSKEHDRSGCALGKEFCPSCLDVMDEWEEKCQFVINLLFKPEKRADLPLHDPEFIEFIEGMAAPIFKDIRAHIALQNLQKS